MAQSWETVLDTYFDGGDEEDAEYCAKVKVTPFATLVTVLKTFITAINEFDWTATEWERFEKNINREIEEKDWPSQPLTFSSEAPRLTVDWSLVENPSALSTIYIALEGSMVRGPDKYASLWLALCPEKWE